MPNRSKKRRIASIHMPVEMHSELVDLSRREGEALSKVLRHLVARQLEAVRGGEPVFRFRGERPCA